MLQLPMPTTLQLLGIIGGIVLSYAVSRGLYNVYFHPLSRFPGPKHWALSNIPSALNAISGLPHHKILELHNKYGDIVRIGPNELACAHSEAWREIYGHLRNGEAENGKDPSVNNPKIDASLISAARERHGQLRRVLAHAFSARAMQEQQPLMDRYINLLMKRLHEHGEGGLKPLNMTKWFEWATFDIVGDLAFGESFDCLENSKSHPWVDALFGSLEIVPYWQALAKLPLGTILAPLFMMFKRPRDSIKHRHTVLDFGQAIFDKRASLGEDRPDFVDAMLRKSTYKMSNSEMRDTCILLTTAGSETTATTLAGVTFLLCTNPQVLTKLKSEVRSAFRSEDEITITTAQSLPYMLAVLKEALRIYPPVAIALPRISAPEGTTIAGEYVPGGVTLGIWQYSVYHNPTKFSQPDSFIPERWLGDPDFATDCKDLHQPFSHGPRNCIGMNLAYVEMRLILARIIWNFDLELAADSESWLKDQQVFFFWDKPDLNLYLKPRSESR